MRARVFALACLAALTLSCFAVAIGCPTAAACLNTGGPLRLWMSPWIFSLWLIALSLMIWLARTAWLVVAASRAVDRLRRIPWPAHLDDAVRRTGTRRVQCVEGGSPSGLCSGWLRPSVLVTEALLDRLGPDELDAVLLHEQHHAVRRDPLRRAMLSAATDVYFFIPLVRWWADRHRANSELAADRRVIDQLGRPVLAQALLSVDADSGPGIAAAFAGATQLRVAQVLGDPIEQPSPTASTWLDSIAGPLYWLTLAWCVLHLLAAA